MKDPAFLFYPADASEDTQFMNRLERGCYFDILKAQKRFGKFTIGQLRKVLGGDFETCWPAIELVLTKEGDFYYIGWVAEKIEERRKFSESRRKNRTSKTSDKDRNNTSKSYVDDMVNENVNENEIILKGGTGGKFSEVYQEVMESVIWQQQISMNLKIDPGVVVKKLDEFLKELQVKDDYHKGLKEIKSHFINWLKIIVEKEKKENNSSKQISPEKNYTTD